MSTPLLLDPVGDAVLPTGYQRLGTEAAWLRLAAGLPANDTSTPQVVVSGSDLCAWAERWWAGRGGVCQALQSPTEHLLVACPALSRPAALVVLRELGPSWATRPAPWPLAEVLQTLYPTFGQPHDPATGWAAQPTTSPVRVALAAHWLLWAAGQTQPWPAHHVPLLSQHLTTWAVADASALFPLEVAEARALLRLWLGLDSAAPGQSNPIKLVGPFPVAVPPHWLAQARAKYEQQFTELNQTNLADDELRRSLNAWWQQHNSSALAPALHELAAVQYAEFLLAYPQLLQAVHLRELLPVLGTAPQAQQLQQALPPPEPADLPAAAAPAAVLQWVTTEYLPYRQWQASQPSPQAQATQRVLALAAQFEEWVLAHYPNLLVGPNLGLLHIQQAESIRFANTSEVTLWVVPDGLGWLDAATLAGNLHTLAAGRVTQPQATACFGLLPTITSLTKQPLLRSTTAEALPRARPNTVRRERAIPGHLNPADYLRDAQPGDLFIWTPPDPDSAYHGQFDRLTIQHRIPQLLQVLAQQLAAAVQAVPASLPLRLVVATDHGRMLGSSARSVAIPEGFESHGRAAYAAKGNAALTPSPHDLARPELAWLEPEAFGLPYWAAAVRGDVAFRTNNTDAVGQLHFPHGGLWPEEVIVPWVVIERTAAVAPLTVRLSGHGLARRQGKLTLTLTNPTRQTYTLLSLILSGSDGFAAALPLNGQALSATATNTQVLVLENWPTPTQVSTLQVRLQLADAQSRPTEVKDFLVQLTSEDFEDGPDLDLNF